MRQALGRAAMVLAAAVLGRERREWAAAMRAEFEVAREAGEALPFALGCLWSAVPQLFVRDEGRRALASHVLAVGILLPVAVLLLASVALGFPYLTGDALNLGGAVGSGPTLSINVANRKGLPLLALLSGAIGVGHLCLAWALLERDWRRVTMLGRSGAATVVSMLIFAAILSLGDPRALPQAALIALELAAVWSVVWWHDEAVADLAREARWQAS